MQCCLGASYTQAVSPLQADKVGSQAPEWIQAVVIVFNQHGYSGSAVIATDPRWVPKGSHTSKMEGEVDKVHTQWPFLVGKMALCNFESYHLYLKST